MGMNVGGSKKGPKSDINVTPLVDVVLVLLIIFMVAMPILMRHIAIEIPRKVEDESKVVVASKPLTVSIRQDGSVLLNDGTNDQEITRVELATKLRPMIENMRGEKVVFVEFDRSILYGEVVATMDTIKGAGPRNAAGESEVKVAIKTQEDQPQPN